MFQMDWKRYIIVLVNIFVIIAMGGNGLDMAEVND